MNSDTPKLSLPSIEADRRAELAQNFREGRKKGVVPVFISFLWFVFALALTVQLSFGDIGGNETAHNLALGLMVGWLPILILASTVDRNHVSADSIREKLNSLIDDVRVALLDPDVLEEYMRDTRTAIDDFTWMSCLHDKVFTEGDFFVDFGGQGRTHWHYGVAHPLLCDFTPTVGLGCRSGGYLVYFVIAFGLLVIEILVWWLTHERTLASPHYIPRIATKLRERFRPNHDSSAIRRMHRSLSWFTTSTFRDIVRNFVLRPGEVANAIWLIYIIFAQTFGAYQTCDCMASNWGSIGGYIDFQTFVVLILELRVLEISDFVHIPRYSHVLDRRHCYLSVSHDSRPGVHCGRILHSESPKHRVVFAGNEGVNAHAVVQAAYILDSYVAVTHYSVGKRNAVED
ncbi:MAG: hypothetical protein Q9167_001668 [Letrouitia subvulpina]